MKIRTDKAGDWVYVTDDGSISNVIIGDTCSYYLMGRAIINGDRLRVSVNELGEVDNSRSHVQAQIIRLFNGTQKKTLTVEGFI